MQEAENMLHLEHHRIVPLYGISSSLENKEIHIIMPFYHLGSLKSYITQYLHELKVDYTFCPGRDLKMKISSWTAMSLFRVLRFDPNTLLCPMTEVPQLLNLVSYLDCVIEE